MMKHPTDFLITCPWLACDLAAGMQIVRSQAFKLVWWLAAGASAVVMAVLPPAVAALVIPALAAIAGAVWASRLNRRVAVAQVVETYRGYYAARGRYAPAAAVSGEIPVACVARLCALAALPLVPVAGWWWTRRTLRDHALRAGAWDALPGTDEALELFLGYPDRTFVAPSGHGGVWFPELPLNERRRLVSDLVLPLYGSVCAGVACGLLLAGHAMTWHWIGRVPCILLFLLGSATCLAIARHAPLFLSVVLAASVARLAREQRNLLPAPRTEWEDCAQRVANSTYEDNGVMLADHLFGGWLMPAHTEPSHPYRHAGPFDMPSPMPLLLHRSVWEGNCHGTGPTRTGKSALFLLGIVLQLLCRRVAPMLDAAGNTRRSTDGAVLFGPAIPMPMLIIELKGDLAVVNTIVEECRRTGRTCRTFTLEEGCATAHFSPIKNLNATWRHIVEFVEIVLDMLSLFHGLSYGRGYYSKQSRDLLLKTVKEARQRPTSWEELHRLLHDTLDHAQHRDVFELLSSIYALAQYPALAPAPPGVEEIDFARAIRDGEVIVFSLRARVGAMTIRDVARMALYCFMIAASEHNTRVGPRSTVCCIDEAQVVCSTQNVATVFQQCSGANMTLILSNQSAKDLNTEDAPHLADTVRTNTHFKQAFGILDPEEARYWIDMSGEDIAYLIGTNESETTTSGGQGSSTSISHGVSRQPVVHKRLSQDVINQVNNSVGWSLALTGSSAGFTQLNGVPRRVLTPWPMTKSEYERRKYTPWPAAPKPSAGPGQALPTARTVNTKSPERVESDAKANYDALDALFRAAALRSRGAASSAGEVRHGF